MASRRFPFTLVDATACLAFFAAGCATTHPALHDPEKNSALKPVPRDANWVRRHEGFVALPAAGGIEVLFFGDTITDAWRRWRRS